LILKFVAKNPSFDGVENFEWLLNLNFYYTFLKLYDMKALPLIFAGFAILIFVSFCTKSTGAPDNTSIPAPYFIPKDQANRMIRSYLTSVGYPGKDEYVRSLALDADALRSYLADTSIKKIQLFLAHNMEHIESGKEGQPIGPYEYALTVVAAGTDRNGQFRYVGGRALDNAAPCPRNCDVPFVELQ